MFQKFPLFGNRNNKNPDLIEFFLIITLKQILK